MNAYGLKHARLTKDQRDSFFFNPPLCGQRASESGVQNVILWWENFGGRGKNHLGKVGQNRNLSLPNVSKCPQTTKISENSVFSNHVQYNEVRSGSHKNHMFSHIKILFKMNIIFGWNHLKRPFLKIEQMR